MYETNEKLFFDANIKVLSAMTLINECKNLIDDLPVESDPNYDNAKKSIADCNIENLVNKIENEKNWQMEYDQDFARNYMTLLVEQSSLLNTNLDNMSSEEKLEYSLKYDSVNREFNDVCIVMLEKNEKNGMLTDEMKSELAMRKKISEQYDLKDDMALLDASSKEYEKLFAKNFELSKDIINLNPSLTSEQKSDYLDQLKTSYDANIADLRQLQSNEQNRKKLEDLYKQKEELGSNWIPFDGNSLDDEIFALKKEMGIASQSELDYLEMNWFDRACQNTGTFLASTVEGIFSVEEQIFDGGVTIIGGIGSWFGADTKWAEDFIKKDIAGNAYSGVMYTFGANDQIAYGQAHETGNFTGEMIGVLSLQFLPGGTAVMTTAHGLNAVGSSAEQKLNEGASFSNTFKYSLVNGVVEATASYFLYSKPGKSIVSNSKLLNKLSKPLVSFNTATKVGRYCNSVFKPSFFAKMEIAVGKEFVKELNNTCLTDNYNFENFDWKNFDWEKFKNNSIKSLTTTVLNEMVVTPTVNSVLNKVDSSIYKDKYSKVNKLKSYKNRNNEKLSESKVSKDYEEAVKMNPNNNSSSSILKKPEYYEKRIDSLQRKIFEENNKVFGKSNLKSEYDFVTKFVKKVTGDEIKQKTSEVLAK